MVASLINATLLVQIGQGAPRVKLSRMQVTFISFLAAAGSLAFIYAVCSATVFPLPFGVLCVAPPDLLVMTVCFISSFAGPDQPANSSDELPDRADGHPPGLHLWVRLTYWREPSAIPTRAANYQAH